MKVVPGFLEDHSSRIFLPEKIIISFSEDGVNFSKPIEKKIPPVYEYREKNRFEFPISDINQSARYIRIQGVGKESCPKWHSAKGGHCWLFSDEIVIY